MKKLGFTLAEVLITLTIVGVIAAMTLPSLTANVQKSQVGPALAKAVNTLENANRMALQQNEVRDLSAAITSANTSTYIGLLETQISGSVDANNSSVFTSKDGISFIIGTAGSVTAGNLTNKYSYKYYPVTIDTNGVNKKPNIGGEDRFDVLVDYAGTVIPVGGSEWKKYSSSTAVVECTSANYLTQGTKCTGTVADNGWKVAF